MVDCPIIVWFTMTMASDTKPTLTTADIDLLRGIFATKDDLAQFATKDDVKEIVKEETKHFTTKDDLTQFATREYLDKTLDNKLAPLKKDIKKIKHDQNTIISFFDNQTIGLKKRITRIENHLDLPPHNPST